MNASPQIATRRRVSVLHVDAIFVVIDHIDKPAALEAYLRDTVGFCPAHEALGNGSNRLT